MIDAYMITGTRKFAIEKIQVTEIRARNVLMADGVTVHSRYASALAYEDTLEAASRLVRVRLQNNVDIAAESARLANNALKDCQAEMDKFLKFGCM